jgi:hypothetical protein
MAIREVQERLRAEGILDATLLDAHSFCWILARHPTPNRDTENFEPAEIQEFNGTLQQPPRDAKFSPSDDAEIRDMKREAENCRAAGQIAEEIALNAEIQRLRNAGRKDLAGKVHSVADRPGLGYDIKSFENDGRDRFIEVKNVSNGNRFFISEGEWRNSRERKSYW